MNIFLSVCIKKCRHSAYTLRIFDVCNQEKAKLLGILILRKDAPV